MNFTESLFLLALALYSLAIWSHKIHGKLLAWMVFTFGTGFMSDFAGTVFICVPANDNWAWNLHTISGLASLLIMGLHFAWALLAFMARTEYEAIFAKYSLYAWLVWLISFVTGLPWPS